MVIHLALTHLQVESIYRFVNKKKYSKMDYCCHIWAEIPQSPLSSHDRVQNLLHVLVGNDLFLPYNPFTTDETMLSSCYSIAIFKKYLLTSFIHSYYVFWHFQLRLPKPITHARIALIIALVSKKFHFDSFFLTSSTVGPTIIDHTYPHNKSPPLTSIK